MVEQNCVGQDIIDRFIPRYLTFNLLRHKVSKYTKHYIIDRLGQPTRIQGV